MSCFLRALPCKTINSARRIGPIQHATKIKIEFGRASVIKVIIATKRLTPHQPPNFFRKLLCMGKFSRIIHVSNYAHNTDLTNVEKMHYLRTSLKDEASRLISNLSLSGDHFTIAWQTLCSRYDNKRLLIDVLLDRLTNLKPLKSKSTRLKIIVHQYY